jgi:ribosomal protein S18 acetylase RimI-like enzyme
MYVSAVEKAMTGIGFEAPVATFPVKVEALERKHESEVLDFLAARPTHTVFMAGFIRDNGLVSHLNRGTFYACRDLQGRLEGVALIGHSTLVETRSEAALAAFARLTQDCPSAHMILGEQHKVETFWRYFAQTGRTPRRVCREVLLERRLPIEPFEPLSGLRQATPNDLPRVLPVNAQMVLEESGVNPLETDPKGFQERWLRRIEQGRVWLWTENGRLIFSANVMSEAPDVSYLEGIYVNPDERGKGYGLRCLSQLSSRLLETTRSLCLFVNEENRGAQDFYRRAGYTVCGLYDTIFLHLMN